MKERPLLFSAAMVRALLDGTKTQTRRLVKPLPPPDFRLLTHRSVDAGWVYAADMSKLSFDQPQRVRWECPHGQPGDRIWVKETIRKADDAPHGYASSVYAADGALTVADCWPWKRPQLNSIHCPRGLSRITLEIVEVRVERLNEISEADAIAEGMPSGMSLQAGAINYAGGPRVHYAQLWDQLNGAGAWATNPWVWVISFRRVMP